ncbi:MAG: DUF4190 domain-containing protein [Labilithrix sp.]|nr:DUF4190 domain-containing protein [Labilithrix sp.]
MGPFHPHAPPPMSRHPGKVGTDGRAVAALVLGLSSITCLGFFGGIPAIVLGAMARREIDRSQGALTGSGMAAGGIVSGLFGTGVSLVVLLAVLAGAVGGAQPPEPRTESPVKVPVAAAGTRSYGPLDVVDLDGKLTLKAQLVELSRTATGRDRTVILQTYVRTSRECAEVAASLPDPRMQKALANVTLIRVDIDSFEAELRAMRVDTEAVPYFYKLDGNARPTDAISADEWEANVPENMAPVLGEFVKGSLGARRAPSPLGTAL